MYVDSESKFSNLAAPLNESLSVRSFPASTKNAVESLLDLLSKPPPKNIKSDCCEMLPSSANKVVDSSFLAILNASFLYWNPVATSQPLLSPVKTKSRTCNLESDHLSSPEEI